MLKAIVSKDLWLTLELRCFQHLLEDLTLDHQQRRAIVRTLRRSLVPLLDRMHDQGFAVAGLDAEDHAPEVVSLGASLFRVVIWEVLQQLTIRKNRRHQLCDC